VRLASDNAAKLVYIIINDRMLKQYNALRTAPRVQNSFKLGWGWPSRDEVPRVVAEETSTEPDAVHEEAVAQLRRAVVDLDAAEQADALAAAAAAEAAITPGVARCRERASRLAAAARSELASSCISPSLSAPRRTSV